MLRIIIASVLLLLSLLTIIKAPTNFFWKLAVGINEFPFITIGLMIIITFWGWWAPNYKYILLGMHLLTLVLFSLPVLRTYSRTADLERELAVAFGSGDAFEQLEKPFSFSTMLTGIHSEEIIFSSIPYKTVKGKELKFDFYPAFSKAKKVPLVIVIHGGSWKDGDSQQLPKLNDYLANRGIHVVSMNYRLAPDFKYPAPVEDVKDVLKKIGEMAKDFNIDMNNIVLLGRSAGGQIALQAAYTEKLKGVKGVIAMYAPADMAWGARIKTNKLVLDADKVMSDYIGGSVQEVPKKYDAASAPPFVTENTIPTLLIHGPIDAMVAYEHSVRLKAKLDEKGVKNYLLDLPTSTHGCDFNFSGPSGQASTFAIERFIHAVIR